MTWSSSKASVRADVNQPTEAEARSFEWGDLHEGFGLSDDIPPTPEELAAQEEQNRRDELETAYAQGFAQGSADGEARARLALKSGLEAIDAVLATIVADRAEWSERADDNLTALALAVARQIMDRELASDPGAFADLVRKALADFPPDQPVKIRLNPHDLSSISMIAEDAGAPATITGSREAQWIPDPDVVRGGCVVEGPDKILDGRVDVCLDRLYWALNDE